MDESESASNVPPVVPMLLRWQDFIEKQFHALANFSPTLEPVPAGVELIEWITTRSRFFAPAVERIVRHFAGTNEWPLTTTPEQAFYICVRLGAARSLLRTLISDDVPAITEAASMPILNDRRAAMEWLLITSWQSLAEAALRATAEASRPI